MGLSGVGRELLRRRSARCRGARCDAAPRSRIINAMDDTGASSSSDDGSSLDTLEFFSGIGGLHCALRNTRRAHRILCAYDVDDAAVKTYRHNHPDTKVSSVNLVSLKSADLRAACGRNDLWLLSPPCQPYTRQGLQHNESDRRATALEHLIDLLELDGSLLPGALLLENVVGFESSASRKRLCTVLTSAGYGPRGVGIARDDRRPTSGRATSCREERRGEPAGCTAAGAQTRLLDPTPSTRARRMARRPPPCGDIAAAVQEECDQLSAYLEPHNSASCHGEHAVPQHVLERYGAAMDLVGRHSRRSMCVTKNYARYVKGTGSIVCEGLPEGVSPPSASDDKSLAALSPLQPRYLAPSEVARLHGFPDGFAFPEQITLKKRYELLGNSLSVQVVTALLRYLLSDGAVSPRT